MEAATPSAWVPSSKPIWFTELGCPASDKGPNQPNVFPDPKSTESALPYYSHGGRSDMAQQRFVEAVQDYWREAGTAQNPVSTVYGGRMVDAERIYLWAWDARPFPAFPQRADIWGDGENWLMGHWLNGRLSAVSAGDLIDAVMADHGLPAVDASGAEGFIHGFVVEEPSTARAALEPIVDLFGLSVRDDGDRLRFERRSTALVRPIEDYVIDDAEPAIETVRLPAAELPSELTLAFRDPFADYQSATVSAVEPGQGPVRQQLLALPVAMEPAAAKALADDRLRDHRAGREEIAFAVPSGDFDLMPGAIIRLPELRAGVDYLVTSVETGAKRSIRARRVRRTAPQPWAVDRPINTPVGRPVSGPPHALLLDLPMLPGESEPHRQLRVAAHARPWRTQVVFASAEASGFTQRGLVTRPATIGRLVADLAPGVAGRIDHSTVLEVELFSGELASRSLVAMLNGDGSAAVRVRSGAWEVLQFRLAEEIAPDRWRVTQLLRGQLGTDDATAVGADSGADFVFLDEAVAPAGLTAAEVGLDRNWRIGPAGYAMTADRFAALTIAGGVRASMPLAPCHLRVRRAPGGWRFTWIRRGRIDADDWGPADIPMDAGPEAYRVTIRPASGGAGRVIEVSTTSAFYGADEALADFGVPPLLVDVTIAQIGGPAGTGPGASARLALL